MLAPVAGICYCNASLSREDDCHCLASWQRMSQNLAAAGVGFDVLGLRLLVDQDQACEPNDLSGKASHNLTLGAWLQLARVAAATAIIARAICRCQKAGFHRSVSMFDVVGLEKRRSPKERDVETKLGGTGPLPLNRSRSSASLWLQSLTTTRRDLFLT